MIRQHPTLLVQVGAWKFHWVKRIHFTRVRWRQGHEGTFRWTVGSQSLSSSAWVLSWTLSTTMESCALWSITKSEGDTHVSHHEKKKSVNFPVTYEYFVPPEFECGHAASPSAGAFSFAVMAIDPPRELHYIWIKWPYWRPTAFIYWMGHLMLSMCSTSFGKRARARLCSRGIVCWLQIPGWIQETLCNYLRTIESDYNSNIPYHNATHASDVLQSLHYLIQRQSEKERVHAVLLTVGHFLHSFICGSQRCQGPGKTNANWKLSWLFCTMPSLF